MKRGTNHRKDTADGKGRPYYRCPGREAGGCGSVGISALFLEEMVLGAVLERLKEADAASLLGVDDGDEELREVEAALDDLDQQLVELAAEFEGARGAALKAFRIAAETIEAKQEALRRRRDSVAAASPAVPYVRSADALAADWEAGVLTADAKHAIIAAVLRRITIQSIGRGKWRAERMRQRVQFG